MGIYIDAGKTWWPARIIDMKGGKVLCRYDGWGEQFDEWVDCESPRIRIGNDGEDGAGPDGVVMVGRSVRPTKKEKKRGEPKEKGTALFLVVAVEKRGTIANVFYVR